MNQPSLPELHVVVEIGVRPDQLWFDPPPEPWPQSVRLWAATLEDEVALFLVTASTYGRVGIDSEATSVEQVLADFPRVLPGGVAVVSDERAVMPSCCCGLEHWHDWRKFLVTGHTPWMGHDPTPLLEARDDVVHVWSDRKARAKSAEEAPITFRRSAFELALDAVEQDLRDFLKPLRAWLDIHAPQASADFVSKFAASFIRT